MTMASMDDFSTERALRISCLGVLHGIVSADLVHDDLVECHEHLLDAQVSFSAGKLSRLEGELCLDHCRDETHEKLGVQSVVVLGIRLVQVAFVLVLK